MSLALLVNSAWQVAAQLKVTDTANVNTSDQTGIENVGGGQRWQYWQSGATADRRLAYINKNGGMGCSHVVLARADRHVGHQVVIHSWSTYSSASTTEYDSGANFNPTLLGPRLQDYVWAITTASKQALSLTLQAGAGGNYTKLVNQLYFANALTLSFPTKVTIERLPFPSQYLYNRESYLVDEQWEIQAEKLSKADVATFEQLYLLQRQPLFIYDSLGTVITTGLLHCILQNFQVVQGFNDIYAVKLTCLALRQWA